MTFNPFCVELYFNVGSHVSCSPAAHPRPTNHLLSISTLTHLLQSDFKPDDPLLKGPKTKEKCKDKKGAKDKRKGQAVDGAEKQPSKAKVDEMLVRGFTPWRKRNGPE